MTHKIKIGICDDEEVFREQMKRQLELFFEKNGLQYEVWEYSSAGEFMEREEEIDLLFLDIEMGGITGIELKDYLQEEEDVRILFVTSHVEGMSEAFGKNVYGFLEKPVEMDRLEKYLGRVLDDIKEERLLVIEGIQGDTVINTKDIFYFVSDGKYSHMVSTEGKSFCNMGMQQLEEMLGKKDFFRCHKSYLVNLKNISDISPSIHLRNGENIPVSRRRTKELKEAYLAYTIRKAR